MGRGGQQKDAHQLRRMAVDYQRQHPELFVEMLEAEYPSMERYW